MSVAFPGRFADGRATMRRPLSLALILCLVLTGIAFGAARGTAMPDGRAVICTGQGPVVMDGPAAPGRAHLCPDMVLSLLAAPPVPPPVFGPMSAVVRLEPHPQPLQAQGRESPRPAARGPPFRQFSALKPV